MRNHADIYETTLLDFRDHLKLERSMSPHTIAAYTGDVRKYFDLLRANGIAPENASIDEISRFLEAQVSAGITKRSLGITSPSGVVQSAPHLMLFTCETGIW